MQRYCVTGSGVDVTKRETAGQTSRRSTRFALSSRFRIRSGSVERALTMVYPLQPHPQKS